MKTFKYYAAVLLVIGVLFSGFALAIEGKDSDQRTLRKPLVLSALNFDGNRIDNDLMNNGMIVSHLVSGRSGMSWPAGNGTQTVFASGVWLGARVNGQVRVSAGEYAGELVGGPYGSDSNDPSAKLYKVNRTDWDDPAANDDFQNWPAHQGAPFVDVNGNGTYEPLPAGPDYPDFPGAQVIWAVMNDGDPTAHSVFQTPPLGVEVQMTIFGFDRPDAFGDMMFVKELIINKGNNTLDDMIIGLWSDPDLGDAADDLVGCDTTLGMGICYNAGDDVNFAGYVGGTPAVGYDFFQGPMVPMEGETAFMFGREHQDMMNLKMTSFTKYINGDPVYYDPNNAEEAYNYMQGFLPDGSEFPFIASGGTPFVHPGDPNLDTGPDDTEYVDSDLHPPDDRRFLMNAGPFTMAPGDSQEVVFAILHAAGGDALNSYNLLKVVDAQAQFAYDSNFILPSAPDKPEVESTVLHDEIILTWGHEPEIYSVPGPQAPSGEPTTFEFEGYRVYQYETANGANARVLATYDVINNVNAIKDQVFDSDNYNELVEVTVVNGTDSGIKRSISITQDATRQNAPLIPQRAYYFGVTSFSYNEYASPKVLESTADIITVRPQAPQDWEASDATGTYGMVIAATHPEGPSDGLAQVTVVDPTQVTGDDYEMFFAEETYALGDDDMWYLQRPNDDDDEGTITIFGWYARNLTTGEIVTPHTTIQSGVAGDNVVDGYFVPGGTVGTDAGPIAEGLMFAVDGPELGILAIEEYGSDDDVLIDGTVDSHLHPSLSQTALILDNRAGGINLPAYNRDYDRFDYWGMDNVIIDFSTPSLGYDYLAETINGVAPFSVYREIFPTMERQQIVAGWWESGGSPTDWDVHDGWETPTYHAPSFEPLYCWVGYDANGNEIPYDPAMEAQYLADNSLYTSFNTTWGGDWHFHYPYITAMLFGAYFGLNAPGDFTGSPEGGVSALPIVGNYDKNGAQLTQSHYFKFTTAKANTAADKFRVSTADIVGASMSYDADNIGVWPNPYFGYNPEERDPVDQQIHFTGLPMDGPATIRIFSLDGVPVRTIHHDAGSSLEVWDVKNDSNIPVASGMYIVHIETDGGEKILKIAVIQPEQRIDIYG